MKKWHLLYVLALICFSHSPAMAQSPTVLSLELKALTEAPHRSDEQVHILIKGQTEDIVQALNNCGAKMKYRTDHIVAAVVPIGQLQKLAGYSFVKRIEGPGGSLKPLNDQMLINNNLKLIHSGMPPLSQSYKGNNVVIGIIDTGVDPAHPDFKDENGESRLLYVWDQTGAGSVPPYGYGTEWTKADFDAGTSSYDDPYSSNHGSNITGIAGGNGRAVNNYTGAAPEADLIVVSARFSGNWLSAVADAVDYIFKKAETLGKPCVINTSIGTTSGARDGRDLPAQAIASMITEKSSRALMASAGNSGNIPFHLGYTVNHNDTLFTWFQYHNPADMVHFEVWADTADFDDVRFALGADRPAPLLYRGRTPFFTALSSLGQVEYDSLWADGNLIGVVSRETELAEGRYRINIEVDTDSTDYYWRFITTGNGRFDVWSHPSGQFATNTSRMVDDPDDLPDSSTFPDIVDYRLPDTYKTLVSSWQCRREVVTVANYVNRDYYYNVQGDIVSFNTQRGEKANQSSLGPTRDNRFKPEIIASGDATLSSARLANVSGMIVNDPNRVAPGGMHTRNGGTSSSSPVVAGAVALYFEQNPDADWQEIHDILRLTAQKDQFTGPAPNYAYGYGKLDAYAMLTTPLRYGCMEPTAYNYDPDANVADSCEPFVYGCTDPEADNYDPGANTDDNSCKYSTTTAPQMEGAPAIALQNQPNPFRDYTVINYKYESANGIRGKIRITGPEGKMVRELTLDDAEGHHRLERNGLPGGIYFYTLMVDDKPRQTRKMVVY